MDQESILDLYPEVLADRAFEEFERTNEFETLEEAGDILGDIISHTSEDDTATVCRLTYKYGRYLLARFRRGQNPNDLENAISFARTSLEKSPETTDRDAAILLAKRRSLICQCLLEQDWTLNGEESQSDLENSEIFNEACELANESLASLESLAILDGPYVEAMNEKALLLRLRWEKFHHYPDLEECIRLSRKVLDASTDKDPAESRIQALTNLAHYLQSAYDHKITEMEQPNGDSLYKNEIVQLLDRANNIFTERPITRIENIMTFVLSLGKSPSAHARQMLGEVYNLLRVGVSTLQDIMRVSLAFDQRDHIAISYGISRYAAAAALEKTDPDPFVALCLLEKGRNVAMSVATEVEDEHPFTSVVPESIRQLYFQAKEQLRTALREGKSYATRQRLLREIKEYESQYGANDSEEMSAQELQALAHASPIIVINITDIRSDAIIIRENGISSLHLPKLFEEEVSKLSWEIQFRLAQDSNQEELAADLQNHLFRLLAMLWSSTAKPILDFMGYLRRDDDICNWPQVCWITTGVLSLYPIHAAGLGIHKQGNVMNRVVSTYAPSLKALLRAQRSGVKVYENSIRTAAVLAMIDTPGTKPNPLVSDPDSLPDPLPWPSLNLSSDEVGIVRNCFNGTSGYEINVEIEPDTNRAIAILEGSSKVIHISCHGYVDYNDPSRSMLLFSDWKTNPLTVERLGRVKVSSQLLVLSACFTANGGVENLQDEMVHLSSALYLSGSSSVMGTLWQVGEEHAREFFSEFYKYISEHEGSKNFVRVVAEACHIAAKTLARKTSNLGNDMRGAPREWAPFICLGHSFCHDTKKAL
ncbi:hypothetical protein TWF694_003831 [Orbilia ellipsospora]|uniref:CHAT domain-containing protein n=1 Tax=Orbilia ellipsospora TaxID=2528407 RepID=A0AAV9X0K0_9PEZI